MASIGKRYNYTPLVTKSAANKTVAPGTTFWRSPSFRQVVRPGAGASAGVQARSSEAPTPELPLTARFAMATRSSGGFVNSLLGKLRSISSQAPILRDIRKSGADQANRALGVPVRDDGIVSSPEPTSLPVKDPYGKIRPVDMKTGRGWFVADVVFNSMRNWMSAVGSQSALGKVGKGIWSLGEAAYYSTTPRLIQDALRYKQPVYLDKDGNRIPDDMLSEKRGDIVDVISPFEYSARMAGRSVGIATRNFREAGEQKEATPFIVAKKYGWKHTPTYERYASNDFVGSNDARSLAVAAEQWNARQFLINKSSDLTQRAFNTAVAGDLDTARNLRFEAIQIERDAGSNTLDTPGLYDPYFSYTWIDNPEREKQFINATIDMELQLGRELTPFEIWKAREVFMDPWREFAGDMLFDWSNFVSGPFDEGVKLAIKPFKFVGGKVGSFLTHSSIPLVSDAARYLSHGALRSSAGKFAHSANEVLMGIAHAAVDVATGEQGYEEFINMIGRVGSSIKNGVANPGQLDGLPKVFGSRQERIALGMANAFATDETLAKKLGPDGWGRMAEDARQAIRIEAYDRAKSRLQRSAMKMEEVEFARLAAKRTASETDDILRERARLNVQDQIEEMAGKEADNFSYDPRNLVSHMASEFREGYLTAHKAEGDLPWVFGSIQRFNRKWMGIWTRAVLSARPAWVARNYMDNTFRALLFGINPFADIGTLVGRYTNDDIASGLRSIGLMPTQLTTSFARSEVGGNELTVYQRLVEGERPRSLWDLFDYARRKADEKYDGKTGIGPAWMRFWDTTTNGIADWNALVEFSFKVRMFDKAFYQNFDKLSSQSLTIVEKILRDRGASESDLALARRIWKISRTDAGRARQMLKGLRMGGSNDLVRAAMLTPDDIDEVLSLLPVEMRSRFIESVSSQLEDAMETARLAGREVDESDIRRFFTDLTDSFRIQQAGMVNHTDLRAAPDPVGAAQRAAGEAGEVPMPNTPPGAVDNQLHEVIHPIEDASARISSATDSSKVVSYTRDSLVGTVDFETGPVPSKTYMVQLVDGKPKITVDPRLMDKSPSEVRNAMQDAIRDVFILKDNSITKEDFASFLATPAKLQKDKPEVFDKLVQMMDSSDLQQARRSLAGLRNERTLAYTGVIDRGGEFANDFAKRLTDEGATLDEVRNSLRKPEVFENGDRQGVMMARARAVEERLPAGPLRTAFANYLSRYEAFRNLMEDWSRKVWPGPLHYNPGDKLRSLAWDRHDEVLSRIYSRMSDDLLWMTEHLDTASPDTMVTPLGTFLERVGFLIEYKPDGSIGKMLYKAPGEKRPQKMYGVQIDAFVKRFFGANQTNNGDMRRLIGEVPWTRDAQYNGAKVLPPADPNMTPERIAEAIMAGVHKPTAQRGRAAIIDVMSRRLGKDKAAADIRIIDELGKSWAKDNNLTLDDWYDSIKISTETPEKLDGLLQNAAGRWYYLKATKVIKEKMPNRATVDQIRGLLKGQGVSPAEMEWSNIEQFLASRTGPVTKQEMLDFMDNWGVQLEEKILGVETKIGPDDLKYIPLVQSINEMSDTGAREVWYGNRHVADIIPYNYNKTFRVTKYTADGSRIAGRTETETWNRAKEQVLEWAYQTENFKKAPSMYSGVALPGGENYREFVFHWNPASHDKDYQGYRSAHFNQYGQDLIAHARVEDRIDDQGRRTLFVMEIQSDWHQAGRKYGYDTPKPLPEGYSVKKFVTKGADDNIDDIYYQIIDPDGEPLIRMYRSEEHALRNGMEAEADVYRREFKKLDREMRETLESDPRWAELHEDVEVWNDNYNRLLANTDTFDMTLEDQALFEQEVRDARKFRDQAESELRLYESEYFDTHPDFAEKHKRMEELNTKAIEVGAGPSRIPPAPFEKNWDQVVMKRMIRYAADNGYEVVAFPTGAVAAKIEGHNIIEDIDQLRYNEAQNTLDVIRDGRVVQTANNVKPSDLKDYVGDDIATQLLDRPIEGPHLDMSLTEDPVGWRVLDTKDVVFGGEKMRWFYDKMLLNDTNKILRPWGAQVDDVNIPSLSRKPSDQFDYDVLNYNDARAAAQRGELHISDIVPSYPIEGRHLNEFGKFEAADDTVGLLRYAEENNLILKQRVERLKPLSDVKIHGFALTDEMRQSVKQGQSLFQKSGEVANGMTTLAEDGKAIIHLFSGTNISTPLHEAVHIRLDRANPEDVKVVTRWLKDTYSMDLPDGWHRGSSTYKDAKEKVARAFENYMYSGQAPTPTLKVVFEKIKNWLIDVYKTIAGSDIDVPVTPALRDLFDGWLGKEPPGLRLNREAINEVQKRTGMKVSASGMVINGKNMISPTDEQLAQIKEILDLTNARTRTRTSWQVPLTRIQDQRARAMLQIEAQEMMLDVFRLEGIDGRPADFKHMLKNDVSWGSEIADLLPGDNPRTALVNAITAILRGEDDGSELNRAIRRVMVNNTEQGVKGAVERMPHPYAYNALKYEPYELTNLHDKWVQSFGRNPFDELDTFAESQANKQALWEAFIRSPWVGDRAIIDSWGQYSNSPELLAAKLRDMLANLPPGTSQEGIESIQMLLFQVENYYAVSNNMSSFLGMQRSLRNTMNNVIPIFPSPVHMPENYAQFFAAGDESAKNIHQLTDAINRWKEHVMDQVRTGAWKSVDPNTARVMSESADDIAQALQATVNLAAHGPEPDIVKQIDEVIGAPVNRNRTHKRVDGKWVTLTINERAQIKRLEENFVKYQEFLKNFTDVPEGALPRTNRFMIDYGDFSNFDEIIRQFVPFWMFTSRSMPFWAETLVEHPQILSFYNKYIAFTRRTQYNQGIYTSEGAQMPSLEGYIRIPGINVWVNPLAPLSFRYVITPFTKQYSQEYEASNMLQQFMMWSYEFSMLFGVSMSPWITLPAGFMGWYGENPTSAIVPQFGLLPPWWKESIRQLANKVGGERLMGVSKAVVGSEVPWKDYLVERRLLANTYERMKSAKTEADKLAIAMEAKAALSMVNREESDLWNRTVRELDMSELGRSWAGYFTGVYAKEFTDAEAEFQRVRDELNYLRDMINNDVGAQIFGADPDAVKRYELYRDTVYDTPEGFLAGLYNVIRWTRHPETGQQLYGKDRREYIVEQITENETTSAFYDTLNILRQSLMDKLSKLPIGAESEVRQAIWDEYFKQRTAIEQMEEYKTARRSWAEGYKPTEMLFDHYRSLWWQMINETRPQWDRVNESWDEYQQREEEWVNNLPELAKTLSGSWDATLMKDFKVTPEEYKAILSGGKEIPGDRKLNVNEITKRLIQETTADGYMNYKMDKDSVLDALDEAWKDLYWNKYWDSIRGLTGYERDLAEQQWLYDNPAPDAAKLAKWVKEVYGDRFTLSEIFTAASGRPVESVMSRTAPKSESEEMEQRVWDILAMAGPNKKALQNEYERLGGYWSDISTFYNVGGNSDAWKDPEKFKAMYDKLVQAASKLGLREPSPVILREWTEAQALDKNLDELILSRLGDDIMSTMSEYWNADSKTKKLMKQQDPRIDQYYKIREMYAEQYPLWAKYYTDQDTSTSSGGSSSKSYSGGSRGYSYSRGGSYRSGGSYSGGSYGSSYSNAGRIGMGYRSSLTASKLLSPDTIGRGGTTGLIRLPPLPKTPTPEEPPLSGPANTEEDQI